jgi:hypothetical protein
MSLMDKYQNLKNLTSNSKSIKLLASTGLLELGMSIEMLFLLMKWD